MIGMKFGRLTVVEPAAPYEYVKDGKRFTRPRWLCKCDCGGTSTPLAAALKRGNSKSCGCISRERFSRAGKARRTHGMSRSKEQHAYRHMMARCYSEKSDQFKNYGARGIRVCDEWRGSFPTFIKDMGPAPSKKHSLERKDVNADYSPQNCVWATWKEQQRNRRNNHILTFNGESRCLAEWCELLGLKPARTYARIASKRWPIEVVLSNGTLPRGPTPKGGRKSAPNPISVLA